MSFTTSYRAQHASTIHNSGLLRVAPVATNLPVGDFLVVDGDATRAQIFRTGRPTYDENNSLQPERIFVVELPDLIRKGGRSSGVFSGRLGWNASTTQS